MLLTLIGKGSIHKLILPQVPIGNYWLSDKRTENEKKLINIEGRDGKWQITSNNNMKIISPSGISVNNNKINIVNLKENIVNKIILKEYGMYGVCIGNYNDFYVLYCSPVYENRCLHLDIKNTQEISIGKGSQNHITYNNKLIGNTHAHIFLNNGRWMIENFDSNFGTYVNDTLVTNNGRYLSNGDIIFILGLKIIIMGNSIFINKTPQINYNEQFFEVNEKCKKISIKDSEEEESYEEEQYSENDYFFRSPRITNIIEKEKVKIDAPPQAENREEMPLILTLGTSLSMGVMMIFSMFNAINGISSGNATIRDTISSIMMSVVMLIGMIVFPILTTKWEKKRKERHEQKRQARYKEYINSKIRTIDNMMTKQRNILFENYVSIEDCIRIILHKESRLWERRIEDHDFLSLRLGIGDVPLKIDIDYPEEHFTMDDDNLVEILNNITNKSKILKGSPVTLSLTEKNISAIISQDDEQLIKFMQGIFIQLITFHSYEDLKIVFLLKKDKQKKWDYVKMFPHLWNHNKDIRFFADDYNDMEEISRYLEREFQNRVSYENSEKSYKTFMPYYLIITDDYKKISSLKIITEILKSKINFGFSILCLSNNLMQLPNECKTFVNIENNFGKIFESEMTSTNQAQFKLDIASTIYFDKILQTIANIPIKYTATSMQYLPKNFTFLEMYDVGLIEQLNILERWKKNDATMSLQAPIGIDDSGRIINLDIHEKFHGPHGLIAGATGSGKSEFIITWILSLAINYHPDDVAFILIDYKGGGLAGAFQKREIKLPHLVGTITNIDTMDLQRSLASIQSELKRRQVIFNEARNITDEGTIDIYKYQKLYHQGIVNKPIPHLLIICDEFAELKQQQEEFMDELISVSRIGRSLGVHLILATQKPAGIVNDQIRSNSKFAICLKVQDREDSMDVIKKPDAANLKNAGEFYFQVGNDEYFTLGQSAYSGAPYFPSDVTKKKVDNSVQVVSNTGAILKSLDDQLPKAINKNGEQLTNIVKYIYKLAKEENIKTEKLWLDNIPENIFVEQIRKKYNVKVKQNTINLVIGEYDDPANQRQGVVNLNLSADGNTIIYGNADSGKETLLSTIIYDAITTYSSKEMWLYILDFGSEASKIFNGTPHIGDIIFMNDDEKINRFFDMIQKEIKIRKELLSDYNGDYNLYLSTSDKPMPMISIIINNYEAFSENYEDKYEDMLLTLTREGLRCGINFIITTTSVTNMRYRLTHNFKRKIALQLNNEDEYYNVFEKIGKKRPSHIFGRGLVSLNDDEIYEFQTAKICEPGAWNVFIKEKVKEIQENNKIKAESIPILPEKVTLDYVKPNLKDVTSVPLGLSKQDIRTITYDFKKNFITIISSKNMEDADIYVSNIIEELMQLEDVSVTIFNSEKNKQNKMDIFNNTYNNFIGSMKKTSKNNSKHNICIIIGIDKFLNDIKIQPKDDDFTSMMQTSDKAFSEMLEKAEEMENYSFIFVDTSTRLKDHQFDEWYKNYINSDNGIWIGNGIEDQYLISVPFTGKRLSNNCGGSFGYLINKGKPIFMKLLGMKEKEEEYE